MDTNQLKRFAQEARNILKKGIAQRLITLGFDANGNASELPVAVSGGAIFRHETMSESMYRRWMALYEAIQLHGVKNVYEEVAYTWFNRFVAIRIMEKNGFVQPMLSFESEVVHVPLIVSQAKSGHYPVMTAEERNRLEQLIDDESRESELFALLINAQCHNIPVISKIFGRVNDYSELLLPKNILAENGFIGMLNHTSFIAEEDYSKPELIGWLYQFYISEKKDEVFASFKNKKKAEAEDIPAATQIFTPNWIVKYMVQNTLGRIYLDNNPYCDLKDKLKYLVEPAEPTPEEAIFRYDDLHQLTTADLGCGSGHILNECFDLLYDIYLEEGYSRREAIHDIFRYNLLGIDLDTRARQLAQFALMMKACQQDPGFIDAHLLPRVLDMQGIPALHAGFKGELSDALVCRDPKILDELIDCFELLQQAENLGSIMKFDISSETRHVVKRFVEETEMMDELPAYAESYLPAFRLILALTDKYAVLDMNPPYMGAGNMNAELAKYVKENYEEGKSDLFSVFMMLAVDKLARNGKYGMINMQSWMFLSSFEKLRKKVLEETNIDSMLHLGPRTFDELSGEVVQNTAFVITNCESVDKGIYYRLIDGKDCADKEKMFLADENRYVNVAQKNFEKIPGSPIGYWVSEKILTRFAGNLALSAVAKPCVGLQTADNARFLRYWHEVNLEKIGFGCSSENEALKSGRKWFPYNKGGSCKWYGSQELIVNWGNNGLEIRTYPAAVIRNQSFYFKEGITFPRIGSTSFYARYAPLGFIYDCNGPTCFSINDINYFMGFLNSAVMMSFVRLLCPTISFQIGDSFKTPYVHPNEEVKGLIGDIVACCVSLSRLDWDSHETSWDFQENELMRFHKLNADITKYTITHNDEVENDPVADEEFKRAFCNKASNTLEWLLSNYQAEWEDNFNQLHWNEEELNRQFIEIYDLADELTPDVPLNEITILQQGEISIENGQLKWHPDVIMKQFISYAIGCMMGRYRLDRPGLHIAYPEPSAEDIAPYPYQGGEFCIDDDGIIPLMAKDCTFDDNALNRFVNYVKLVFGEEYLTQNLNFLESSLGKSLEQYLVKDFWKDHVKMYQKRPIYWLFSSEKGAFQCLVYMHRMNPYTVEKIRSQYLLRHIQFLTGKIADLEANVATLSTAQRKELDSTRKALKECLDYDMQLKAVADLQIPLDLDDGFVVNYAKYGKVVAKVK